MVRFRKPYRSTYLGFWSQNSEWFQRCDVCTTKVSFDWLVYDTVTECNTCRKCISKLWDESDRANGHEDNLHYINER